MARLSPLIERLAGTALTLWLAYSLCFFALRWSAPQAPLARLQAAGASGQQLDTEAARLGLNAPLLVQYRRGALAALRGEFGVSWVSRERVSALLLDRLGATLRLALAGGALGMSLGGLMGSIPTWGRLYAPLRLFAGLVQTISLFALAAPPYWTATLLLSGLSLGGRGSGFWGAALVLGLSFSGGLARVLDERLQATLAETFIQTAQAKGLGAWGIYQHALRPSLPLFVSTAALQSGFLLGGTVMVEMIFVRRGLGTLLFQAVNEGDYPVMQGGVLLLALLYILTRHAGESLRQALDPR